MTDRTLFDHQPAPPSQPHSATSRAAATAIRSGADTLRMTVYRWLLARGGTGATDEEMQDGIPMVPSTQRPRRVELQKAGLVVDSGDTRRTRSNRRAVVWLAVPQGDQ
jgi:hypothetical protein